MPPRDVLAQQTGTEGVRLTHARHAGQLGIRRTAPVLPRQAAGIRILSASSSDRSRCRKATRRPLSALSGQPRAVPFLVTGHGRNAMRARFRTFREALVGTLRFRRPRIPPRSRAGIGMLSTVSTVRPPVEPASSTCNVPQPRTLASPPLARRPCVPCANAHAWRKSSLRTQHHGTPPAVTITGSIETVEHLPHARTMTCPCSATKIRTRSDSPCPSCTADTPPHS